MVISPLFRRLIMYNVIDLFSGAGGLSYGFAVNPEFKIIMANEYNKDIAHAYSVNYSDL